MPRVRYCVECPKCRTRYLPSSSPYRNGSYLIPVRRLSVNPVLVLRYSAGVQSVQFDELEAIRNLQTSLSSRLRFTGRSVGYMTRDSGVSPN